MKHKYEILKVVTTEFIVTVRKKGEAFALPVAKCNTEASALAIKEFYEKSEQDEN